METPQLRRQARLGGIEESILTTLATSRTVYSLKLETFKKWNRVLPFRSVNLLEFSYLGIHGETLKGKLLHKLLFGDLQSTQSPQSGINVGSTVSPSTTSVTFSPTLSTTLLFKLHFVKINFLNKNLMFFFERKLDVFKTLSKHNFAKKKKKT